MSFYAISSLILSAFCSAAASVILKYPEKLFLINRLPSALLMKLPAILFYGAGFLLYAFALKQSDISKAYPLMVAFAMLQIALFGSLLGELITFRTIIGTAVILIGIVIVSGK